MQVVSDLQQRPRKGRLRIEKLIIPFFDLCTLIQLVTWLVHVVTTVLGANRTFTNTIMLDRPFELVPSLSYKTKTCVYNTTRSLYAFDNVKMTLSSSNVNDVFVDQAIQMRLAFFIGIVTLLVGFVNRLTVELNLFSLKVRNFVLWKDVLSATELLFLTYTLQIAIAAQGPATLLQDYLRSCGVHAKVYLPFVRVTALYVFASLGFLTYAVTLIIYLRNALPKYGVMTVEEIAEYKEWLRAKRAEVDRARLFIDEAKLANARLHMVRHMQFPTNAANRRDFTTGLPSAHPRTLGRSLSHGGYPYTFMNTESHADAQSQGMYSQPSAVPWHEGGAVSVRNRVTDTFYDDPYMCASHQTDGVLFHTDEGGRTSTPLEGLARAPVNMPRKRSAPSSMLPHQRRSGSKGGSTTMRGSSLTGFTPTYQDNN